MFSLRISAISTLLLLPAFFAQAATVKVDTSAAVSNVTAGSIPADSVFDGDTASSTSNPIVSVTSSVTHGGPMGAGSATATASANAVTGELKAKWQGNFNLLGGVTRGPGVSGTAIASIGETLTLNGTGTLTLSLLYDLNWASVDSWHSQGQVRLGSVTAQDGIVLNLANSGSFGGVDDYLLSVAAPFTNANNLAVEAFWNLHVQKLDGPNGGMLDASNTGTIFFDTSGTLTAVASDSRFLSNAAYPDDLANTVSAVPLPASIWFLGLGILGLMRIRRRR